MCRDLKRQLCTWMCAWSEGIWVRCPLQARDLWSQVATSNRRPCPWPRVLPPLEGSCLRFPEFHWERPRQCPRKPCYTPTRAYPKIRGQGGGDLPAPEAPVPLAPVCILRVFHFSGFMLLFQRDRCLLCPFPIVKAISVRLQYFKDETKQSICLGNQKSPLVCPFSGEQGFSSSSSLDFPFTLPPPPLVPLCGAPPGGHCLSVPVSVMGSHLAPLLSACLCLLSWQDGHSQEAWGLRPETGRAQSRGPRPP